MPLLFASIASPPPEAIDYDARWATIEAAALTCWHGGQRLRREPGWADARDRAVAGELPILPWRGGVEADTPAQAASRSGTLQYLAMWQGLRNEDLRIHTDIDTTLTCSRTGAQVTFRPCWPQASSVPSQTESPAHSAEPPAAGPALGHAVENEDLPAQTLAAPGQAALF